MDPATADNPEQTAEPGERLQMPVMPTWKYYSAFWLAVVFFLIADLVSKSIAFQMFGVDPGPAYPVDAVDVVDMRDTVVFKITAKSTAPKGQGVTVSLTNWGAVGKLFDVAVAAPEDSAGELAMVEKYQQLSLDSNHARFIQKVINEGIPGSDGPSEYIVIGNVDDSLAPDTSRPYALLDGRDRQRIAIHQGVTEYHIEKGNIHPGMARDEQRAVLTHGAPVIRDFFYITPAKNFGAAWSMFSGRVNLLSFISFTVVLGIAGWQIFGKLRGTGFWLHSAIAMILGGAAGNFYDRIRFGGVRDFLDGVIPIVGYNYPIFNIADVWLVIGVGIYVVWAFFGDHAQGEKKKGLTVPTTVGVDQLTTDG